MSHYIDAEVLLFGGLEKELYEGGGAVAGGVAGMFVLKPKQLFELVYDKQHIFFVGQVG